MAGTWESQNKVIPGAYINLLTNTPLSITAGDRGTVVIAQELSVGTDDKIYEITATDAAYPDNATAADKKPFLEQRKCFYISFRRLTQMSIWKRCWPH